LGWGNFIYDNLFDGMVYCYPCTNLGLLEQYFHKEKEHQKTRLAMSDKYTSSWYRDMAAKINEVSSDLRKINYAVTVKVVMEYYDKTGVLFIIPTYNH
jgi:hypothetical protein